MMMRNLWLVAVHEYTKIVKQKSFLLSTFAMPVIYTWRRIFDWYDYADSDYRWFYNMLLVASNAGQNTPADIPVISFVHWHTIETRPPGEAVPQLSETMYQELLWHMLLRGTDTFFVWSPRQQAPKEIRLVHQVYAEAQRYGEFLSGGRPITFAVPKQPGPVVSGLRLKDRILIRRTDFGTADKPVRINVDDHPLPQSPRRSCADPDNVETLEASLSDDRADLRRANVQSHD